MRKVETKHVWNKKLLMEEKVDREAVFCDKCGRRVAKEKVLSYKYLRLNLDLCNKCHVKLSVYKDSTDE